MTAGCLLTFHIFYMLIKNVVYIVFFIVTFVQAQNGTVLIFLHNIYIYALIFIRGDLLSVTPNSLGSNVFN